MKVTMQETRQETRIEFPHLDGMIEAIHPFMRRDYFILAEQIDSEQRPTMSETISLIHDAYENPKDDELISSEIKSIMREGLFYAFNGILYIPKEGILFTPNPKFMECAECAYFLIMNKDDLMSKLGSKEENGIVYGSNGIRFLKGYNFNTEFQVASKLARNPFVIALAGENSYDEGLKQADKLSYIAGKYKERPCLFAIKNPERLTKKVASVSSYKNSNRLFIDGDDHGSSGSGCSFRVVHEKNSTGNQC